MRARGFFVIVLCLAVALPALAAESHDKHAAAAHFQSGRALYAAGRFADALDEFQAGYQAYPLAGFLVNIGQCERKLDQLDAAAASFQKFLDSDPPSELRGEVTDALAEVNGEIERRARAEAEEKATRAAARQAMLDSIAKSPPPALTAPSPEPERASASFALTREAPPPKIHKKHRAWLWALVGVAAAGAVAAAVGVGVVESQAPQASLGIIDGRR
jgi:tetratricopeptide (TPR) repeat protein